LRGTHLRGGSSAGKSQNHIDEIDGRRLGARSLATLIRVTCTDPAASHWHQPLASRPATLVHFPAATPGAFAPANGTHLAPGKPAALRPPILTPSIRTTSRWLLRSPLAVKPASAIASSVSGCVAIAASARFAAVVHERGRGDIQEREREHGAGATSTSLHCVPLGSASERGATAVGVSISTTQ
jgi:hypothetical protein